jgi:putative tryptophan/tyrosine transport system substrate-binding protein
LSVNTEVVTKRIGLLHDLLPKAVRIVVLVNPANAPIAEATLREVPEAARALGLQIRVLNASTSREIEAAFASLGRDPADALYVCQDLVTRANRLRINTLALAARLPVMHASREFIEAAGLMSYGPNFPDLYRRTADYVDKILRGAKPADLPVEQPTKFELVVNLTTAKALGIEVPPTLLARADEVIE